MLRVLLPLVAVVLATYVLLGPFIYVVRSSSMEPSIPQYSYVFVQRGTRPLPGEVGAYLDERGRVIVHRLLEESGGLFVFKGDANPASDPPVEDRKVLGRVVAVIPRLGIFSATLWSPLALAGLFALFAAGKGQSSNGSGNKVVLALGMVSAAFAGGRGFPSLILPQALSSVGPALNLLTVYAAYKLGSDASLSRLEKVAAEIAYLLLVASSLAHGLRWVMSLAA